MLKMMAHLVIAMLLVLPSCGTGSSSTDLIVDQEYLPAATTTIDITTSQDAAQTFTARATGFLTRVDLMLAQTVPGGALNFDIRAVTSGTPDESDTNVLVSVALPDGTVPGTPGLFTFDLTGLRIPLLIGVTYAITLRTDAGTYSWDASQPQGYARGSAWARVSPAVWTPAGDMDLHFRTWIIAY